MNDLLQTIVKNSPHLSWMEKNTVFITVHGSRAYGTHTETSDYDYKGIAVAPKEYLFSFNKNFEQAELKDPNPDAVIYSIQKFFALASATNPNIIEVLHTDPSDHILTTKIGQKILDHKNDFLSKKVKYSFAGYSRSQLNRLQLHRRYLLNPPKGYPSRKDMGLPEQTLIPQDQLAAANAAIQKELDMFQFDFMESLDESMKIGIRNTVFDMLAELKITADDHWGAAARKVGLSDNFIEIMAKERSYTASKREYDQYQNWVKTRNPKRAADEAKHGYDTKHGYHLVRLLRMAKEMLITGEVIVKRPDFEELLSIRNGAWSFDQLLDFAITKDKELDDIYKTSNALPHSPNLVKLNKLCQECIEEALSL